MDKKKKILCLLLLLAMVLGGLVSTKTVSYAARPMGEVTLSVEKFTIGQGYLIEPTQMPIQNGTSVGDVLLSLLDQNGYEPEFGTGKEFYLSGILDADSGVYRVPAAISTMGDMTDANGRGITPPTGRETNAVYPHLCEHSYMPCSGWMYTVNGEFPSVAMDGYVLKDGDIVRIQYTLYGYGGDLGERYANNPYVDLPDRNPLTRRLALMRKYKGICDGKGYSEAYDTAYAAAINMDISNSRFYAALNALPPEEDIIGWGNQAEAAEVESRIRAIGTVNLGREAAITAARDAFDSLAPAAQAMVPAEAVDLLQKAETTLARLKKEKADKEAADKKAADKEKADKEAAGKVVSMIKGLGSISLAKASAVSSARKAYDALNADAKKLVSSDILGKLKAAEEKIAALKKEQALKEKNTPPKVVIKTAKPGKKQVKLTWKKTGKTSGYQIFMSTKKASGFKKIATIKKAKTVTFTKKKLKSKKAYYFKIRAYKKAGKKTYYGKFSKVKKAKAK